MVRVAPSLEASESYLSTPSVAHVRVCKLTLETVTALQALAYDVLEYLYEFFKESGQADSAIFKERVTKAENHMRIAGEFLLGAANQTVDIMLDMTYTPVDKALIKSNWTHQYNWTLKQVYDNATGSIADLKNLEGSSSNLEFTFKNILRTAAQITAAVGPKLVAASNAYLASHPDSWAEEF